MFVPYFLLLAVEVVLGLLLALWIIRRKGLLSRSGWRGVAVSFAALAVCTAALIYFASRTPDPAPIILVTAWSIPFVLGLGFALRSGWAIPCLVTGCVYGAVLFPTIFLAGLQGL